MGEDSATLTIDGRADEPDGALVLSLAFRGIVPEAGDASVVRATLRSRPGHVDLAFGPCREVAHWPALICRHAVYRADGASLVLRLDPGDEPDPLPGSLSIFRLAGRSERRTASTLLATLAAQLGGAGPDGDPRLRQAVDVVADLAEWLETSAIFGALPAPPPAAKAEYFLPSFWGVDVDDVVVSGEWSHVRLGYKLPRLDGIWTSKVTWRVFHAGRRFGIEFRCLTGDHPPAGLLGAAESDDYGPLLRAEMSLDDPFAISPSVARLNPHQKALVVAIARQTALDLPGAMARSEGARTLRRERWRHWSRVLPDALAAMPANA